MPPLFLSAYILTDSLNSSALKTIKIVIEKKTKYPTCYKSAFTWQPLNPNSILPPTEKS